ncbi:hypothetical protein [Saccharothrix obliqua]|uniref:hypothetical protein n=1 Tax=Saccharothrix obliqua TaxID=2861747 RepID=UPI001C5F25AE|nr:hypothetical protein [Saccharothrix obliqua]MBW4722490.1 hypothetical protein [Saccharothrix obliqua]
MRWTWLGAVAAPHHGVDPAGAVAATGGWLRLLTVAALVVVAVVALVRPVAGLGARARAVAVPASAAAVVGELALAPARVDPRTAVLPVVLATGALAVLPLVAWARGPAVRLLPAAVGIAALVAGTDPAAADRVSVGDWTALRASALAWVAALAWFALSAPAGRTATRLVTATACVVAVAVVAALPGFVAAGEHTAQTTRTSGT